jgi:hypothetical protein
MIGREPGEMIKYETVIAGVAAPHIHNHNEKALNKGASFGQQPSSRRDPRLLGRKERRLYSRK